MTIATTVNSTNIQSQGRKPRGVVLVNNTVIPWESFEVDQNNFYVADKFRVEILINSLPKGINASYFGSSESLDVQIYSGFPSNPDQYSKSNLTELIEGNVDDVDYEPFKGKIILSGRNFISYFLDTKTSETFGEQFSSDVVSLLATRHGLTPVVTPTSTLISTFYNNVHYTLTKERTEWDILTFLAKQENYDIFVIGKKLYFQPKASTSGPVYAIICNLSQPLPSTNVIDIAFSRNLTLASDVVVKIQSWNLADQKSYIKTATAKHIKTSNAGNPINYQYTIPNLTPQQASEMALNLAKEISSHELRLKAVMPGDVTMTPQSIVQVAGTQSIYDQQYFPSSILHRMSAEEGYVMTIEAKNNSGINLATV